MLEGVPGGLDGEVDVSLVGLGDVGQHVAGPRVPGLERLACETEGMRSETNRTSFSAFFLQDMSPS